MSTAKLPGVCRLRPIARTMCTAKPAGGARIPLERELRGLLQHKRLTAEVESLQLAISKSQTQFRTWRRRNVAAFVGGGIMIGAVGLGGGGYLYVRRNPSTLEQIVTYVAAFEFEKAGSYERRLKIYFGLPEPEVPFSTMEAAILERVVGMWQDGGDGATADEPRVAAVWAQMVNGAFAAVDGSALLTEQQ